MLPGRQEGRLLADHLVGGSSGRSCYRHPVSSHTAPPSCPVVHCPNQTCAFFVLVLDSTNNICVRGEPDALIYELLPISRRIGLVGHLVFAVVEFFPDHWDCCHGSSCALVESLLLDSCMNRVGIICLFAIWSSWFHYLIKGSGCDEASFLGTCT